MQKAGADVETSWVRKKSAVEQQHLIIPMIVLLTVMRLFVLNLGGAVSRWTAVWLNFRRPVIAAMLHAHVSLLDDEWQLFMSHLVWCVSKIAIGCRYRSKWGRRCAKSGSRPEECPAAAAAVGEHFARSSQVKADHNRRPSRSTNSSQHEEYGEVRQRTSDLSNIWGVKGQVRF